MFQLKDAKIRETIILDVDKADFQARKSNYIKLCNDSRFTLPGVLELILASTPLKMIMTLVADEA